MAERLKPKLGPRRRTNRRRTCGMKKAEAAARKAAAANSNGTAEDRRKAAENTRPGPKWRTKTATTPRRRRQPSAEEATKPSARPLQGSQTTADKAAEAADKAAKKAAEKAAKNTEAIKAFSSRVGEPGTYRVYRSTGKTIPADGITAFHGRSEASGCVFLRQDVRHHHQEPARHNRADLKRRKDEAFLKAHR